MDADVAFGIWGATAIAGLVSGLSLLAFVIVPSLALRDGHTAAPPLRLRPVTLTPEGRVRCPHAQSAVSLERCRGCAWFEDQDRQTPSLFVVCGAPVKS